MTPATIFRTVLMLAFFGLVVLLATRFVSAAGAKAASAL